MNTPAGQRRRPAPRRPRRRNVMTENYGGISRDILVRQREQGGIAGFGPAAGRARGQAGHFLVISHRVMERVEGARLDR
jgi:hypothetical protein